MVKNAKSICVAICFGSSNNLTGLINNKNAFQAVMAVCQVDHDVCFCSCMHKADFLMIKLKKI